ncbi:AI-2 transport protein TqsA [Maioricimonas rarisocia]|uniref:AI-2 transport protein TqsA n=1 Tax=Maioricimonas rarisocia TaxID=2528026 RepID=A0A517Z3X1_9PLAN|nr:AI-2E family transporter [Maioricimonas rarisocia]QDU37171.1 AI-2 transport protein TqsA [Maioricimonas rarisocia]
MTTSSAADVGTKRSATSQSSRDNSSPDKTKGESRDAAPESNLDADDTTTTEDHPDTSESEDEPKASQTVVPTRKRHPGRAPYPMSANARRSRRTSFAMVLIAVLLSLYTIYFTRTVLMPVVAGCMLALLTRPLVRRLRRYGIPDAFGGALVLLGLFIIVGGALGNLVGPAQQWLEEAPDNLRTAGEKLNVLRDPVADLSRASEMVENLAAGEVDTTEGDADVSEEVDGDVEEELASAVAGVGKEKPDSLRDTPLEKNAEEDEPVTVEVRQPRLVAGLAVLSSTGGVVAGLIIMFVLAYFLLASGDQLLNNILHLLPSMREKRSAVELVHSVEQAISSYLLTVTVINIGLGIVVAIAMWLLGLPNALLWGVMATLFNFVPLLGALCGVAVIFLVSILTFDSIAFALLPPFVFWIITTTEGNFVTPMVLGKSMSLNPFVVFLFLTIWAWMWGIGGAFLAVPILAVLKVGFDQFERTRPIGTLLGGASTG